MIARGSQQNDSTNHILRGEQSFPVADGCVLGREQTRCVGIERGDEMSIDIPIITLLIFLDVELIA